MQLTLPRRVRVATLPWLVQWFASAFPRTTHRTVAVEPPGVPQQHPALPWWFDQSMM